jgi:EF hand
MIETIAMYDGLRGSRMQVFSRRSRIAAGLVLGTIGALMAASSAIAQTFPSLAPLGGRSTSFLELDRDKDGVASHAEFMQHRDDQFARLDTNGDGFIDHDEYVAARPPKNVSLSPQARAMREARFRRISTGGSGKISKAEWSAESERLFAASDANKDGSLSQDEFRGPLQTMEP